MSQYTIRILWNCAKSNSRAAPNGHISEKGGKISPGFIAELKKFIGLIPSLGGTIPTAYSGRTPLFWIERNCAPGKIADRSKVSDGLFSSQSFHYSKMGKPANLFIHDAWLQNDEKHLHRQLNRRSKVSSPFRNIHYAPVCKKAIHGYHKVKKNDLAVKLVFWRTFSTSML